MIFRHWSREKWKVMQGQSEITNLQMAIEAYASNYG